MDISCPGNSDDGYYNFVAEDYCNIRKNID